MMKDKKFNAKTRSELAQEYGVCRRTFYSLLKKRNIQLTTGLITPNEQQLIYNKLGKPSSPFQQRDGMNS